MGKRRQHEALQEVRQQWPLLWNLLNMHFNQDYMPLYGSLDGAFNAAAGYYNLADRRGVLKELREWTASKSVQVDPRPMLADLFGVALRFRTPAEGRRFVERLSEELLSSVRSETAH